MFLAPAHKEKKKPDLGVVMKSINPIEGRRDISLELILRMGLHLNRVDGQFLKPDPDIFHGDLKKNLPIREVMLHQGVAAGGGFRDTLIGGFFLARI